ncbi:acetyltransferase [Campylobacter jejuni]|uniref:AAC(3) family N-acetyltransferase n=1 Tax=Campylobacter jejuni TaxID=197 RepID=UPI000F809694|nr:AAC(3) family N-acetyltransferase [Campylobacter jejuni]RTJ76523.1 acetyltransferase [Campylobacter jejuni]RTJ85889.1 acetyltransferase [Campylobacter jejuni]RTJ91761.1 acetyltransferase [Campylobacter jejuni]
MFSYKNKLYTKAELIQTLQKLGICEGDMVYMHSEVFNFGVIKSSPKHFLQNILEAFDEVLGSKGTLVMPTFTYSFCDNKIYNKNNSKCTVGALNEYFRNKDGVYRTNDPIFSFAIKGSKEKLFHKDSQSCFGKDSVYDILTYNNTKVILFGGLHLGFTYFHYIEEMANISYRYHKTFKGTMIDEQGISHLKQIQYFVRDLDKITIINQEKVFDFLKQNHLIKIEKFGGAEIVSFDLKTIYDTLFNQIKLNEDFLLFKDSHAS